MNRLKVIKVALVAAWALGMALLVASGAPPGRSAEARKREAPPAQARAADPADYVGTDTCTTCHQDQTDHFAQTPHAKLEGQPSWKGKVTGCESCHGPGREHVEAGGDKAKIRSFDNLTAKQSSETCLTCHAGRDEHNNYRRGEHWRNDVGCVDCHSSHSADRGATKRAASVTFVADENREKPGFAAPKMLRASETQLCMQCHTETKHQFNKPFKHKVLEGAMKCSDCHNPHGGFEQKQARLATGADAACVKCHADKQGPFTYEHAPVRTEGCATCHAPHGSQNPRLLKTASVAQLCLQCHSQDHGVGAQEPIGPAHNLNLQYRDCTTCHMKIHGSHTSPVFMR